jgi:hypothetical protein
MIAKSPESKAIDVQKLVAATAKIEIKLLSAGVDTVEVWTQQASHLSRILGDTLRDLQNDKASLSGSIRQITGFGRQNAEVFAQLSNRLSVSYYDELDRLAGTALQAIKTKKVIAEAAPKVSRKAPTKRSAVTRKPGALAKR